MTVYNCIPTPTITIMTTQQPSPSLSLKTEDDKITTMAQILLMGDSLTQLGFEGWASTLANVYQRRADVINRGCSGYNTQNYLDYILPALPSSSSDGVLLNVCLVILFFGANDAALEAENPKQYIPLEDYRQNLTTMIQRVNETYNTPRILLMTPPPLDHEQRLAYQKQRYGDLATGRLERTTENTARYAEACRQVAEMHHIPCIHLFQAMTYVPDYVELLNDGLHFSIKGHAFVGAQVLDAIEQHYPELRVVPCPRTGQYNNSASSCAALPTLGPYHDQI